MNNLLFSSTENDDTLCGICLETFDYPCQLPCGHIYCFLCIKGWIQKINACAICRRDIPHDLIKNPNITNVKAKLSIEKQPENDGEYVWYYGGFNGFWQYDTRTNTELEKQYQINPDRTFQIMIAGHLYFIDFANNLQIRVDDPSKKRKIKRDVRNISEKKGVAGLSSKLSN
jgi:E3 ubiquitin-protein ligase RNF146